MVTMLSSVFEANARKTKANFHNYALNAQSRASSTVPIDFDASAMDNCPIVLLLSRAHIGTVP